MLTRQYRLSFLLCAFSLSQCKPDPKWPTLQNVTGAWEVQSAERNKRPTGILAGTYFVFSDNGSMKSNLPIFEGQEEWQSNFEIVKDTLVQKSIPGERYHIMAWTDSTITLEFSTRGIPFRLVLAKSSLEKIYPSAE